MCQQIEAHYNVSDDTTPHIHVEADLISTFVDSMRIIPYPEVPLVFEGTPICKIYFAHNMLCKGRSCTLC
jgi:hypothetical protein